MGSINAFLIFRLISNTPFMKQYVILVALYIAFFHSFNPINANKLQTFTFGINNFYKDTDLDPFNPEKFTGSSKGEELPFYNYKAYEHPNKNWDSSKYLAYHEDRDNQKNLFNNPKFLLHVKDVPMDDMYNLKITELEKFCSIQPNLVNVSVKINFKFTQEQPKHNSEILLTFPSYEAIQITAVNIFFLDENITQTELQTHHVYFSSDQNVFPAFYSFKTQPISSSSQDYSILINYSLGRPFSPLHTSKTLDEEQVLQFLTYSHNLSPYPVEKQSTYIRFESIGSSFVEESKLGTFDEQNNIWIFGPYMDVPPFTLGSPVSFTFTQVYPLPFLGYSKRFVHISQWGNLHFHESHQIINEAAPLKGHFSRRDVTYRVPQFRMMRSKMMQSDVLGFVLSYFPPEIQSLEYFDVNGNISTSYVNMEKFPQYYIIELYPRFPLLGGWNTHFNVAYNLPSKSYIFESNNNKVLRIPFAHSLPNLYTETYKLEIVFPYGTSNIRFSSPLTPYSYEITSHWDWFQTFLPSQKLVLNFRGFHSTYSNVLTKPIFVFYDSNPIFSILLKTINLMLLFLIPLSLYLLFNRFSMRIISKEHLTKAIDNEEIKLFEKDFLTCLEDLMYSYDNLLNKLRNETPKELAIQDWTLKSNGVIKSTEHLLKHLTTSSSKFVTLKEDLEELITTLTKLANFSIPTKNNSNKEKVALEERFTVLDNRITSMMKTNSTLNHN